MRSWRSGYQGLLSGAGALLLAGCGIYHVNSVPDVTALEKAALQPVQGDVVHTLSRVTFPPEIGGARRTLVYHYDEDALDISVGYNPMQGECAISMTVYVYPAPRQTYVGASPRAVRAGQAEFVRIAMAHADLEIRKSYPGTRLLEENQVDDVTDRATSRTRRSLYEIGDIRTEVRLFTLGYDWFVKYRVSYPASCGERARELLRAVSSGIQWGDQTP